MKTAIVVLALFSSGVAAAEARSKAEVRAAGAQATSQALLMEVGNAFVAADAAEARGAPEAPALRRLAQIDAQVYRERLLKLK